MSNSEMDRKWSVAFIVMAAFVAIIAIYSAASSPSSGGAAKLHDDYQKLPEVVKIETRNLVAKIALAEPGDFIVRKDGGVMRVKVAGKGHNGHLELRVWSTIRMETHLVLRDWVVWAVVDRLVKQTDPDAGKVALKFLNQ